MSRLHDEKNIWLCTVRADGTPHLTPIWFAYHDERFWIATSPKAVKTRNALRQPKVALSLESGNAPLVVEGTATVHSAPFPAGVCAAFKEKFDWDISSGSDNDLGGPIALWEIAVDRWLMGDANA